MRENIGKGTQSTSTRTLVRQLRRRETPAEEEFWELVRDHRFDGFQFRRQYPIKSYIADFYCAKLKLVIELDGEIHKTQEDRDRERDENLESYGIHVIRIKNEDLLADPQVVLERLRGIINTLTKT